MTTLLPSFPPMDTYYQHQTKRGKIIVIRVGTIRYENGKTILENFTFGVQDYEFNDQNPICLGDIRNAAVACYEYTLLRMGRISRQ